MTGSVQILLFLLIPAAYLFGAVPFGIIISRSKGVDIRAVGSGNIGATNVLRSVGKVSAVITLVCDILKGTLPMILLTVMLRQSNQFSIDLWGGIVGLSVILGHLFPVFLSFKGGKGVATGLGVMLIYSPVALLLMVAIWLITAVITKYSSLSAIIAFTLMPIIVFVGGASAIKTSLCFSFAVLIVFRHMSNIKSLMNGTETKIGAK